MAIGESILLAVGDVGPCRSDPATMFAGVRGALARADLCFGQLETAVTDRGVRSPHARLAMRTPPQAAAAIAAAGFDVMSFAGNHCLDWGEEGFADTLTHMAEAKVKLAGAGVNIEAARTPVFATCGAARIAFLAYSSILPENYWAERDRPGSAPMRAHTRYEMIEPDQPGTPPRIITEPHGDDLAALTRDVTAAKRSADIVALSMHWGIHMTPVVIADYQKQVAHAAIDAGADIVLGHHPHILKGVEFYRGAAIVYSMGNFAIEQPQAFDPAIVQAPSFKHLLSLHPDRQPSSLYLLPEDTRKSMIVEIRIRGGRIDSVSALPVWIDDRSTPHALTPDAPHFSEVADYLRDISARAGFATTCAIEGDRVVLSA
jgi:poly-gamma-glutamate synthesis protein (capsule biosynthesis protein)